MSLACVYGSKTDRIAEVRGVRDRFLGMRAVKSVASLFIFVGIIVVGSCLIVWLVHMQEKDATAASPADGAEAEVEFIDVMKIRQRSQGGDVPKQEDHSRFPEVTTSKNHNYDVDIIQERFVSSPSSTIEVSPVDNLSEDLFTIDDVGAEWLLSDLKDRSGFGETPSAEKKKDSHLLDGPVSFFTAFSFGNFLIEQLNSVLLKDNKKISDDTGFEHRSISSTADYLNVVTHVALKLLKEWQDDWGGQLLPCTWKIFCEETASKSQQANGLEGAIARMNTLGIAKTFSDDPTTTMPEDILGSIFGISKRINCSRMFPKCHSDVTMESVAAEIRKLKSGSGFR